MARLQVVSTGVNDMFKHLLCICVAFVPAICTGIEDGPRYLTEVRPILAKNCFACHGPDEHAREAELRLDMPTDTPAIVAGRPSESEFIVRITSGDPELVMPPRDSGHALTKDQIEILTRWIAAGAKYEAHWAFVTPVRPDAPDTKDSEWCRSDIDRFVLKRQQEHSLAPSPPADPYALIRRVSLDLTGLPPSSDAADTFAKNPSPDAFEQIVDNLLASPGFGEHWASMWLDLARYADTKGYEKDQPRNIWRYRDWVIDAFNRDLPFDQFTVEQIAGDLLPNAASDQILATAFHRNTMTNDEGGTDNEEFRIAAVKDRVDTTIQVWMGLTMGCAKCHSHKYDPISQNEYYRFLAFFNQTEDADRPDDAPRLPTPTAEQEKQLAELNAELADLRTHYEVTSPEFTAARRRWEAEKAVSREWQVLRPLKAVSQQGSTLTIQNDDSVLAAGAAPPTDVYELTLACDRPQTITAVRIEALTHDTLPKKGPGRSAADPNFVLSELTADLTQADGSVLRKLNFREAKADYSQNNWQVAKAIDGNDATGWAVSPKFGAAHTAVFSLAEPLEAGAGQSFLFRLSQQYGPASLLLGRVRVSVSSLPFEQLEATGVSLSEIAAIDVDKRSADQEQRLLDAYRKVDERTAAIWKKIQAVEKRHAALKSAVISTPVMRELPVSRRRQTFIHVRGNFLEKGDEVAPGFPKAFSAAADSTHQNRLAVAEWLMSPQNPLTARVAVNRIWSRLFGRGFVETEEDFGTQGMLPSHPELLDWLAVHFRDDLNWSLKRLCKAIVMSSTYQQTAVVSEASRQGDPENRWLSRGSRFRLSAEVVRDQALSVAGLLSDRIGGPSVMPPQPKGIWRTTYSKLKWSTAEGEDRYRRGIYTFLRRTSPYPSMLTFDGTSREVCQIRRIRTNTPMQALVIMNDPVYLEAAGNLAVASLDHDNLLVSLFRRVLIRPPVAAEIQKMRTLYSETLSEYQTDAEAARDIVESANIMGTAANRTAQLAALTVVAGVLLNLDETVMRP